MPQRQKFEYEIEIPTSILVGIKSLQPSHIAAQAIDMACILVKTINASLSE